MVRRRGLEPPRGCPHQPLKLARLPVPPLPQANEDGREYRIPSPVPGFCRPLIYSLGASSPLGSGAAGGVTSCSSTSWSVLTEAAPGALEEAVDASAGLLEEIEVPPESASDGVPGGAETVPSTP